MRPRFTALLIALTLALPLLAATLAGVKMDDSTAVNGQSLVLNGVGLRKKLFIKVYVGALYLPAKQSNPATVLATDEPPGGVSPASPRMDPVWSLLASANCAALGHISISEKLLATLEWRNAPAFQGWMLGAEFSLDPWTLSNIHLQVQNYLMTMVLGGVFDRHPKLVFGTAEFTGHWVGPLAENMDRFYGSTPFNSSQAQTKLTLKPSDYIRRNVRVACFDFEPIGTYISRYGFEEVFCYASDFPHHEGGKDPMNSFVRHLEGHSPEVLRKVFVDNGRSLLPD